LLVVEGLLWLSERYRWFGFGDHSDWATLFINLTVVGAVIFLMPLCFIASLLFRWRFQFSIRSLLVLVIAVAIPCSWLAAKMQQAGRQRQAIALVQSLGGVVHEERYVPDLLQTLHGLLPDVFFAEIHFVEFDSKSNAVSDAHLDELVKLLPHIDILLLSSTNVTNAGMETLNGLNELNYLSLSNTKVTDVGLERLSGLKQLHMLFVDNTEITDAGLERLKGHKLRMLRLSGTQVTDIGLGHLQGQKLTSLALCDTKITDAGLNLLKGQDELQSLLLNGTRITDAGLENLKGLKSLRKLQLSRTTVTDKGMKHLESLTTLIDLDLSGTQVTDRGLGHLQGMNELQQLNLGDTKVTDSGLERLAVLKLDVFQLVGKLSLVGTKTTKAGVKKLQQAWPNCTIER
jgi:hypothetical protein